MSQKNVLISAAIVTAILVGLFLFTAGVPDRMLAVVMVIAAILGSVVSQSRRKEEFQRMSTSGRFLGYLLWKCAVSVVFALLLYLIFVGDILSGAFFPKFVRTDQAYGDFMRFLATVDPASYKDAALVVVWSFIAGFSEKFVPNILAQIEEHKEKKPAA